MRKNLMLLLGLASITFLLGTIQGSVVVNEVELNPSGAERAHIPNVRPWIELYNNDDKAVNIGKWSVNTSQGKSMSIPEGTIILGLDYYIIPLEPLWFEYTGEMLVLNNEIGIEIDRTPPLNDTQDNELAWTRDPDGRDTNNNNDWKFLPSRAAAFRGHLN
jgi:Lamin Tail Domain